ncbi:MAG: energy-coupling factor ABC transporter ATP-binding protein [Oscillospiraceae bacterium]|nr:energy-coupling factor ABC transporter ATP-binding protein [Oscillospiraceae bacterium]
MIQFENVSFSYTGNVGEGLENINITIADGECILLCGRSGCGKTTFTRMVNGLIPYFFPGELTGRIIVNGMNIAETPMYQIAGQVGSVFQNPRTQFFNTDTDSEIAFGIENASLPSNELHCRVEQAEKDLHIEPLSGRSIFELSGGEKQKIAFASVYAMNPNIYLLDEPSSNLDMDAIEELKETLRLMKAQGKTILVAEHRLYYLMDVIDRAIYFEHGKMKKIASPHELMALSQTEREKMGLRATDLTAVQQAYSCTETDNATLELKNVTIRYKKRIVLENLCLSAKSGEVIGIVGHNGAGKTSFSRTICGLHKEMDGQIMLNGSLQNRKALMKKSYLVMQDVNYELFAESVEKECIFGLKNPDMELASKTLTELDLDAFRQQHPNTLSGGQKQRLAVAVSMVCGKEILVFDEPTSGLDYDNMMRVAKVIERLAGMGKIIFVTTHDYEFVCQTCNRVLHLDEGEQKEDWPICPENRQHLQKLFRVSKTFSEGGKAR